MAAFFVSTWVLQPRSCHLPDLLPKLVGQVSSLYGLHVEVQTAILLLDGGISAVCQRTGRPIAQPSHVVLVSAEVLCLCLHFIRAVAVIDDLRQNVDLQCLYGVPFWQAYCLYKVNKGNGFAAVLSLE